MIDTLQLGNISMRGYIEYHLRSVGVKDSHDKGIAKVIVMAKVRAGFII